MHIGVKVLAEVVIHVCIRKTVLCIQAVMILSPLIIMPSLYSTF